MIYFVQSQETKSGNGPIKIGFTTDPDLRVRISDLQVGNAYPLCVVGVIASGTHAQEKWIHYQFWKQRMCGEWFKQSPELKKFVSKHASGYLWGLSGEEMALGRKARPLPKIVKPQKEEKFMPPKLLKLTVVKAAVREIKKEKREDEDWQCASRNSCVRRNEKILKHGILYCSKECRSRFYKTLQYVYSKAVKRERGKKKRK